MEALLVRGALIARGKLRNINFFVCKSNRVKGCQIRRQKVPAQFYIQGGTILIPKALHSHSQLHLLATPEMVIFLY